MTRTTVRLPQSKAAASRAPARAKISGRCEACGAATAKWVGRCPECGEWGSVVEVEVPRAPAGTGAARAIVPTGSQPVSIAEVDPLAVARRPTGVGELDRVLGGGLVAGSVTLVGGEPGMGKSTLMLQALGAMAAAGARVLLVSAEESLHQVRLRADRLGTLDPRLSVVNDTSLPNVLALVATSQPDVVVVDSIQTVFDPDLSGVPGSTAQVRDCAQALVQLAKATSIPTLLVGHVTKDGNLAGPRVLEHIVDTVLQFEGDRHHALRMVRALKHRFGSTDELGLFAMTETGLADVRDASALLLTDRCIGLPGSVVAPVLDGVRPLLVETQALVSTSVYAMPRRSAQAFDNGRLSMLAAIANQRLHIDLAKDDVYGSVAGGVRVEETGADLAMLLAMASAKCGHAIDASVVALGEVGLGGEVRAVPQAGRRLAEAARLGFRTAFVPESTPAVSGLELVRIADAGVAIDRLLPIDRSRSSSPGA